MIFFLNSKKIIQYNISTINISSYKVKIRILNAIYYNALSVSNQYYEIISLIHIQASASKLAPQTI